MDEYDQKVVYKALHRLVQRHSLSSVLYALARIAYSQSLEFRQLREAAKTGQLTKTIYRKEANHLENLKKDLHKLAIKTHRIINGGR